MPTDKIIPQCLQFNSHLGHFLTWERPLDTSSGISPRYLPATNSQLTASSLYRYDMMSNYAFFSKDSRWWGRPLCHPGDIWISVHCYISSMLPQNSIGALLPHQPKGLGMQRSSAVTLPSSCSLPRRGWWETGCMVSLWSGWTPIRPGSPLWRKWLSNWPPWSPVDLIGLMPQYGSMGTPTMHHSLGRGTWVSCQKEAQAVPPVGGSAN